MKDRKRIDILEEEKYIFSKFSTGIPVTKGRLIREKHINLFVLHDSWDFIRKWRPKDTVKLEHFYIRFDEEWKVTEKFDRTKGMS